MFSRFIVPAPPWITNVIGPGARTAGDSFGFSEHAITAKSKRNGKKILIKVGLMIRKGRELLL
jgi:hypothetical protein